MSSTTHGMIRCRRQTQAGASLIELLVGITIGLLVVAAAIGSLSYTRISSTSVGDSSRLQQDAATAFRVIGQQLRQTGAQRLVDANGSTVEFNPTYFGLGAGVFTRTISGTNGAATDTLVVSFDADASLNSTDCLGNTAGGSIVSTFALSGNELRCTDSNGNTGPLIEGTEDLQVWFGFRNGTTLQYQTAPNPANDAFFNSVETVMVCIRLRGDITSNPSIATTGCNGENIANDGRIRRVFTRVFNLRNQGI